MNDDPAPHRKRIKHFEDRAHVRELTFSCFRRMPLLTNDAWRSGLSASIDSALVRHQFSLVAFVFMPEHVHLLLYPRHGASSVSDLLKSIKRPYSFRIKRLLAATKSPLLRRLTVVQRPGVTSFRFWQEGPGYDRNIYEVKTALAAIDYIHANPVRRGLTSNAIDWPWSSARFYQQQPIAEGIRLPAVEGLPSVWLD